jgi:hypothetical protein
MFISVVLSQNLSETEEESEREVELYQKSGKVCDSIIQIMVKRQGIVSPGMYLYKKAFKQSIPRESTLEIVFPKIFFIL